MNRDKNVDKNTIGMMGMPICFVCNGLTTLDVKCTTCQQLVEDYGRVVDYYGDYAPYIEVEDAQMIDGYPETNKADECVHLSYCPVCQSVMEMTLNQTEM
ncbi:hypothetical protein [Gracilibacillus halophilus]|nr:hypothetical protein [Gracilibacillus halophilus]